MIWSPEGNRAILLGTLFKHMHMSINQTSLRLWVEGEIHKINFQLNLGTVLPVVGRAKIELLENLTEDFNLHEVRDEELTYHNNFWSLIWSSQGIRAILLGTTNTHTNMKKFLKRLDWIIDYYFVIFLYNPHKVHRYHKFMKDKWGERYESPSDLWDGNSRILLGMTPEKKFTTDLVFSGILFIIYI